MTLGALVCDQNAQHQSLVAAPPSIPCGIMPQALDKVSVTGLSLPVHWYVEPNVIAPPVVKSQPAPISAHVPALAPPVQVPLRPGHATNSLVGLIDPSQ